MTSPRLSTSHAFLGEAIEEGPVGQVSASKDGAKKGFLAGHKTWWVIMTSPTPAKAATVVGAATSPTAPEVLLSSVGTRLVIINPGEC